MNQLTLCYGATLLAEDDLTGISTDHIFCHLLYRKLMGCHWLYVNKLGLVFLIICNKEKLVPLAPPLIPPPFSNRPWQGMLGPAGHAANAIGHSYSKRKTTVSVMGNVKERRRV